MRPRSSLAATSGAPSTAADSRERKRATSQVMASSMSWSRPPGNQRYTLARETLASRATCSTVMRERSTCAPQRTVAASTSSRVALSGGIDEFRLALVLGLVTRCPPEDQRVADDGDGREDEPLNGVTEVRALVEHGGREQLGFGT